MVHSLETIPTKWTVLPQTCRQMAESLIKNGLCKRAEVQLSYAIGVDKPLSLMVSLSMLLAVQQNLSVVFLGGAEEADKIQLMLNLLDKVTSLPSEVMAFTFVKVTCAWSVSHLV